MATYFIADLHFGHKNVLAYDNREFPSIEEHDKVLVDNWNSAVGIGDDVWILGDISWYPPMKTIGLIEQLNGTKHLCVGNHDKKLLKNKDVRNLFCEIVDYKEIQFSDDCGVVLCHYPIPCYNHHFHGWCHLYGHVHTGFEWNMIKQFQYEMKELCGYPSKAYNVGCMVPGMDYTPRTLEEIVSIFGE